MKSLFSILFFLLSFFCVAQQTVLLKAKIVNLRSGESIKGVSITADQLDKQFFFQSDSSGEFQWELLPSNVKLTFFRDGYESVDKQFTLATDTSITISMLQVYRELQEVVVYGNRIEENENRLSIVDITPAALNKIPALVGEKDFVKAMMLLPGVQNGSEGSADIFVRGGSSDQNLYLLDNATLYHSGHLFGFLSSFNPLVIENARLYKAAFPARFGGRLSSVIDLKTKQPNADSATAALEIGLISSKVCIELPIVRKKLSLLVAARRTYADVLLALVNSGSKNSQSISFTDVNAKLYWQLKRNKISFNIYGDHDTYFFNTDDKEANIYTETRFSWKNKSANVVWERPIGRFNNTIQAGFTGYEVDFLNIIRNREIDNKYILKSSVNDLYIRQQAEIEITENVDFKTGAQYTYHQFKPSSLFFKDNDTTLNIPNIPNAYTHELALHAEADIETTTNFSYTVGARITWITAQPLLYPFIEPRLVARYRINQSSSLHAAYSRMVQSIHLLTNPGLGMPVNIWIPPTTKLTPETSEQYSLAYTYLKTIQHSLFVFSTDIFYKQMSNILAYRDGFSSTSFLDPISFGNQWENTITTGKGYAYGVEIMAEKKSGDFTGMIGYSWGKVRHQFDELNNGEWFNAAQDIRHSITISGAYKLSEKWSVGANWMFRTGRPITLPIQTYNDVKINYSSSVLSIQTEPYNSAIPSQLYINGARNSIRMLNYHRLDITFSKKIQMFKRFAGVLEFGVYNVYNRKNPYYYYIKTEVDANGNVRKAVKSVSLFPIIPNISLQINF